jgi:hypothetical protein
MFVQTNILNIYIHNIHMNFDPIKSININIFSNNEKKMIEGVTNTINYCNMLLREIKKDSPITYSKKIIMEHMYNIYYCFKCIGIMNLISNLKIINILDKQIENYLDDFFMRQDITNLLDKLKKDSKINKKDDDFYFFDNMYQKCLKRQQNPTIMKNIKKTIESINNILINEENINIPHKLKKYFNNNNNNDNDNDNDTFLLDRNKYYYLQRKIKNPNIRKNIEDLYFIKSDKCMGLLEELAVLRSDYANKMGHKTFFDYKNNQKQNDSSEILNLINDLILKIDGRTKKESIRIQKKLLNDGYKKKVEMHDFIYYYEVMCSKCLFSLEETTNILFELIKKYFHLTFTLIKNNEQLWENNIQVYRVTDHHNNIMGTFYMDLEHKNNKKNTSPLCIHLCHNYEDMNGIKYLTKIALIANYKKNKNDKCISHTDIILLFKEMGNVIQFFCYKTETGNMFYKDDLYLLTSKIMEYFAWEKNILIKLCNNNMELVEHLLFTRFIDLGNSIKLKCINAYFDHIIHNSTGLIKDIKTYGKCSGDIFKNIYQQIYKNILGSQKNIFNIETKSIHPIIILQEINGSETLIYESILVDILSYGIYNLIKNKEGKKYVKILSKANTDAFKNLLNQYTSKLGDNYTLYLHELIGYDEIDTEMNMKIKKCNQTTNSMEDTSANFFDDKTADQENTITIDRKLELC